MIAAIEFAAATDVGLKRQNNEDSYIVLAGSAPTSYVVILADGMGGHQKGELASSLAVKYASERLAREIKTSMNISEMKRNIASIVESANVKVYLQSLESPESRGMGTTLTVAVVAGEKMIIGHVGDCRAYILRERRLISLTTDHTLVQVLVDRGDLSLEAARRHPKKNVVTRALGAPEYVKADILDATIQKNDRLLFSSDGLHDYVEEGDIARVLGEAGSPREAVDSLIQLANSTAGMDNVTVIVGYVR